MITNGSILQGDQFVKDKNIIIESGRVKEIVPASLSSQLSSITQIDASSLLIIPGLIDLHLHVGNMTSLKDPYAHFEQLAARHCSFGTTRFLGSFCTTAHHQLREKVIAFRNWSPQSSGARPLGHLFEGPFINVKKAGAQEKKHIIKISPSAVKEFLSIIGNERCIVALAPEEEGAMAFIREMIAKNIIVAVGHTDADYQQAVLALDSGVRYAVHLFNQMRPIHHRDPGVIGAFLERLDAIVEIITDGIHLSPTIVRLIYRLKGNNRIVLASDSVLLPSEDIQEPPRLGTGALAGGAHSLLQCTMKCADYCNISFAKALRMATLTPAEVLGVQSDFGSIKPAKVADLVLLTFDGRVMMTMIDGQIVFNRLEKKKADSSN